MEKETFTQALAKQIVRLREEKNLSQSELAEKALKTRQSICRLESGRVNPTVYFLKEVAQALDKPLGEIVSL